MMELTKKPVPKIDYLRESGIHPKQKATLSSWKQVLKNDSLTAQDKYLSVMERVEVLESHAQRKEVQLRNMKDSERSIAMKEEMDRYYLESVAAKMVVLKDVILKDS